MKSFIYYLYFVGNAASTGYLVHVHDYGWAAWCALMAIYFAIYSVMLDSEDK